MIQRIEPGERSGKTEIPASKSRAQRLLICAALSERHIRLRCRGISRDIAATMACLSGMGSETILSGDMISVRPSPGGPDQHVTLRCGESGSTLRFLLPVAGALGLQGEFILEGRLPQRPLQPLWDVLLEKGMTLSLENDRLRFGGRLCPGDYAIPGDVSSQYISGLLFALPLLSGDSTLTVTGRIESADYIAMTEEALEQFGLGIVKRENTYRIPSGGFRNEKTLPDVLDVEADWSSAAFFLCLGALSRAGLSVTGMNLLSRQGDRRILELLNDFGARVETGENEITVRKGMLRGREIDASGIPDLVPVLAAVAAVSEGTTVFVHAERLRLKESDRLQTTCAMLNALGADAEETETGLIIHGKDHLRGGTVSSFRDHRIAMSAAVAASACEEPVTVTDAECTEKSFPGFWEIMGGLK